MVRFCGWWNPPSLFFQSCFIKSNKKVSNLRGTRRLMLDWHVATVGKNLLKWNWPSRLKGCCYWPLRCWSLGFRHWAIRSEINSVARLFRRRHRCHRERNFGRNRRRNYWLVRKVRTFRNPVPVVKSYKNKVPNGELMIAFRPSCNTHHTRQ